MTAHALAGELGLPLFTVRLDGLITKYMGETIAKLRLIFDAMAERRGVYLFDEFDSIGSDRGSGDDVGEIRRVLNAFLMYIERDTSLSLVIAATNHPARLDSALHRRFDDVVTLSDPAEDLLGTAIANRLASTAWADGVDAARAARAARGLNFSDAVRAVDEAIKDVVLSRKETVTTDDVIAHLNARKAGS
jgi:SpoVK/Ycf46/Vps4 family AAA+-type ATPase